MKETLIKIDKFTFAATTDPAVDAVSATEVWVFFLDEPCCDENGHQYRFYLPAGIQPDTLRDVCSAFTKAVHCEQFASAA